MDFDCGWKSFDGNLSPFFENSFSHAPSPYPEHLYNIRSGPSSLVNLPCCNSPGCSTTSNFTSDPYNGSIINQNFRYNPYQPSSGPYRGTNYRRLETRYFYPNSVSRCSLTNEKQFDSYSSNPQNLRMPPNMYGGKYDVKSNYKSNSKRKRQKISKNPPIMPNRNYINQNINNNQQASYDPSILFNSFLNKEVETKFKQENNDINYQSVNEPNYSVTNNYSQNGFDQMNTDNAQISIEYSSGTAENNSLTNAVENALDKSDSQNTTILNSFSNEHEGTFTDLVSGDAGTSTNVSEFDASNFADLSNCQVTHITMPENSIFNVQDIQQENLEGSNLENYFFQPIFEGKDEKGEDIVILVGNSGTPSVNIVNTTETLTNNQGLETIDNQPQIHVVAETVTLTNGTALEPHVEEVNNEIGSSAFSSHVDNYGAEETVVTSKKKYLRSKKTKNKINESPNENIVVLENLTEGDNHTVNDFTSQQSTSRENGHTSENTNQGTNPKNLKCNGRCQQSCFRQWIPKWKRRLQWKYNNPMIKMQQAYFRKFMTIVKLENEHLTVNEDFWKMYRIIVTQIGGNVLKTLYNILPTMIRNLETSEQRRNNADLRQHKTQLQVKFPSVKKKQNKSRN